MGVFLTDNKMKVMDITKTWVAVLSKVYRYPHQEQHLDSGEVLYLTGEEWSKVFFEKVRISFDERVTFQDFDCDVTKGNNILGKRISRTEYLRYLNEIKLALISSVDKWHLIVHPMTFFNEDILEKVTEKMK